MPLKLENYIMLPNYDACVMKNQSSPIMYAKSCFYGENFFDYRY
jgi:hypothetical protein